MKNKDWNINFTRPAAARALTQAGFSPLLSQVLALRGIENAAQGLRWLDIKRYGIEITRRTLEPDPAAEQYDAGFKILKGDVDVLKVDDPRRAMQIPPDTQAAGIAPNPR